MKTIVFGGTGWVGHTIVKLFHAAGHEVTACSRGLKSTYQEDMPDGVRVITADKDKEPDIARVLKEGYEVVIDAVPTEASIRNIAAHAQGIQRYIHCSSTGAYAPLPFIPGDETMPFSDYRGGWKAKSIVDSAVLELRREKGFPATVIRPSYITGPGLLPLDNLGGRREDFIPDILNRVPLDLPGNGMSLLHPVHVEDLARSFLLAAGTPESTGEIYNVCLEKAVTITRYVEITAAALLAEHMCYCITKARTQLGYKPHCSTEEAIVETALWAARLR